MTIAVLLTAGAAASAAARAAEPASVPVQSILSRSHDCGPTLTLRSQALTAQAETNTCAMLGAIEQRFHATFHTQGKPVKHDHNTSLRANIYASRADFVSYAAQHFNMPTNNGGMYLEGLPDQPGNQAEFVANQRPDGTVHNLEHEYVHYLDGRFNLYGDFCVGLHDSHSPPENCALPSPLAPYLVWWTEGVAEFISKGQNNPSALKALDAKHYALSELFDTAYEVNNDSVRIYGWGYWAVRFMMERHRGEIERMLTFTRAGDYPRYQALARGWGSSMDAEFASWLTTLSAKAGTDAAAPAKAAG